MNNIIKLSSHGYEAHVSPMRGANCIYFANETIGVNVLRTPEHIEDFETENPFLYGMPLLFPPNRISGGKFEFEGRDYIFPVTEQKTGCFVHGTLHETKFDLIDFNDSYAKLQYIATTEKPYLSFPHAFTMTVTYSLNEAGLQQIVEMCNDSSENMPVALGFHTTFNLPFVKDGDANNIRLKLPVGAEYVRNIDTFLPTGEVLENQPIQKALVSGQFSPCENNISKHFKIISDHKMILSDTLSGVSIVYKVSDNYGYWMLFNGGSKNYICVEPQTWLNNAPNAPFPREESGFDAIKPKEIKRYTSNLSCEKFPINNI